MDFVDDVRYEVAGIVSASEDEVPRDLTGHSEWFVPGVVDLGEDVGT